VNLRGSLNGPFISVYLFVEHVQYTQDNKITTKPNNKGHTALSSLVRYL